MLVVYNFIKFSRWIGETTSAHILNVVVGRRPSLNSDSRHKSKMTGQIIVCNRGIFEDEFYLSMIIPHNGEKTTHNNSFNLAAVTIENLYEMHRRCVAYISEELLLLEGKTNVDKSDLKINFSASYRTFIGTKTSDAASGQTYAAKYGSDWPSDPAGENWTTAQDAKNYLTTTAGWSIN